MSEEVLCTLTRTVSVQYGFELPTELFSQHQTVSRRNRTTTAPSKELSFTTDSSARRSEARLHDSAARRYYSEARYYTLRRAAAPARRH